MGGAAVEGTDTLCLGHTEGGAKQGAIVIVLQIGIPAFPVQLFAYVIAGIEFPAVFQRGDGKLLDVVHRQVEVFPVMSVVGMTVILHLESLIVRTTGVVHHHDKRTVQLAAHRLLVERLRGVFLRLCQLLAVLVLKGISELLHGFSYGQAEHLVYLCQRLRLGLLDIRRFLAVSHHLTQLQTVLTQLRLDDGSHP